MIHFGEVIPVRSKIQYIPYEMRDPHYTDERFTRRVGGLTIFLAAGLVTVEQLGVDTVEGANYIYSDRLLKWYGIDKTRQAHEEALQAIGDNDTAAYYEAMLQRVYEDPTVVLQHIVAGVNAASGYSYHVYGTVSGSSTVRQGELADSHL